MTLSDLVRAARESRGWSKSELARQAKVDRALVSRIEEGERTGSVETVVAVAKALDIDLNALKGERGLDDLPTSATG